MVDYIKNSSSNYKSCDSWLPCTSLYYKSINFTIHHTLKNNRKKLVKLQQENTNINNLVYENVRFIYVLHPFAKKGTIIAVTGVLLLGHEMNPPDNGVIHYLWSMDKDWRKTWASTWGLRIGQQNKSTKTTNAGDMPQKKTQTDQWSILTEIKANQAAVLAMLWDKWCE